ncbi:MAG: SDR family NAD(P)-dependent oxidoreductase [Bernardetiaceae bacterium]|nr:SDR family NAD(P)-dependent oxidoreductase [Bernardetiaceae bacterium]
MNKIILITGANKGIGFEAARQLAGQGHQVILAARNPERGQAALAALAQNGLTATWLELDVAQPAHWARAATTVRRDFGRLDVLVNNAGILRPDDRDILTAGPELVQATLATNALAPLHLTQALAPLLPAGGRVVMVSSGGGSLTDPVGGWSPVYCVSKTLLNGIARQLAHALQDRQITVNAMCPGWVRTDMGGRNAPRSVAQGADTLVWLATTPNQLPTGRFFRDRKEIPW